MKDTEEICGKCIHHRKRNEEWICDNPESECYGCYTEYNDSCNDFEERPSTAGFQVTVRKRKKF